MLRLTRLRSPAAGATATTALRATATTAPRATAALNPLAQLPLGARALRTARGGTRRRKDHEARFARLREKEEQRQQQIRERALAALRPPSIPGFIRVRDLAKELKKPLDEVLKRVVMRANRRFHFKSSDAPAAEFKTVKQIVLPFRLAQDVATQLGKQIAYDDVEPAFSDATAAGDAPLGPRQPVIAVMGHVDHGKTTLMDTLRRQMREGLRQLAPYETQGITQKINVCEATLGSSQRATFLDTPGHFHFFRMRSSAAHVADAVLLIVAADEGVLLQTEESIGALEAAGLPAIVCINKVDLLGSDGDERVRAITEELRSFVALQDTPVLQISGKTGAGLDEVRSKLGELMAELQDAHQLDALVGPETPAEGLVLESVAMRGRGTVLRVLLRHGELAPKQHFAAGMIHGVVRSLRDAEGHEVKCAGPGMVVDVIYSNKSKNVDAPNEMGFFVLPEARAKQVVDQRQLALDFEESLLPGENGEEVDAMAQAQYSVPGAEEDVAEVVSDSQLSSAEVDNMDEVEPEETDGEVGEKDAMETKYIIVKADGAGSLTSIQDTVDEMPGITTVRLGIGNITSRDIDVAINSECPIFGFNVKLRQREATMATERGVRVVLHSTVHELIEEVAAFQEAASPTDSEK